MSDLISADDAKQLISGFARQSVREQVMDIQEWMAEQPQVDVPIEHWFAHGLYVRQMRMPAGQAFVGKIHKSEHIVIIAQGSITLLTDEGVVKLQAPATFVSKPGAKRVGFVHEDLVMLNVHHSFETDMEKLEQELIAPDFAELDSYLELLKLTED
jgi:quercetin dioxygenase-like cupin family protein